MSTKSTTIIINVKMVIAGVKTTNDGDQLIETKFLFTRESDNMGILTSAGLLSFGFAFKNVCVPELHVVAIDNHYTVWDEDETTVICKGKVTDKILPVDDAAKYCLSLVSEDATLFSNEALSFIAYNDQQLYTMTKKNYIEEEVMEEEVKVKEKIETKAKVGGVVAKDMQEKNPKALRKFYNRVKNLDVDSIVKGMRDHVTLFAASASKKEQEKYNELLSKLDEAIADLESTRVDEKTKLGKKIACAIAVVFVKTAEMLIGVFKFAFDVTVILGAFAGSVAGDVVKELNVAFKRIGCAFTNDIVNVVKATEYKPVF